MFFNAANELPPSDGQSLKEPLNAYGGTSGACSEPLARQIPLAVKVELVTNRLLGAFRSYH